MSEENPESPALNEPKPADSNEPPDPFTGLFEAFVEAIQHPEIRAIPKLGIDSWKEINVKRIDKANEELELRLNFAWWQQVIASIFAILVFSGLGLLAWKGAITKEAAGAILASLIGYWFGRQSAQKDNSK